MIMASKNESNGNSSEDLEIDVQAPLDIKDKLNSWQSSDSKIHSLDQWTNRDLAALMTLNGQQTNSPDPLIQSENTSQVYFPQSLLQQSEDKTLRFQ